MKISIRPCPPKPGEKKEPELQFWLEQVGTGVRLKVKDVANGVESANNILQIDTGGRLILFGTINPAFGLMLDAKGKLKPV